MMAMCTIVEFDSERYLDGRDNDDAKLGASLGVYPWHSERAVMRK